MSNPQEEIGLQVASVPYTMSVNAPPPYTVPLHYQMNVQPNVYESASMWTVSPGSPHLVYAAAQPPSPGFQVPAGVNPQVTGQSQMQESPIKGKLKSLGAVGNSGAEHFVPNGMGHVGGTELVLLPGLDLGFRLPLGATGMLLYMTLSLLGYTIQRLHERALSPGLVNVTQIVLIVMAILQIGFGISLKYMTFVSVTFNSGIPFWGPICYITTGSLSIAAEKGLDLCQIRGSLAFNILSSIFSLTAIILNCVDYVVMNYTYRDYDGYTIGGYIIDSFLLIFNLLVFCVSISNAVFGCRALEHAPSNTTMVFVIQNVQPPTLPTNSPIPQGPLPPPYLSQSDEKVGHQ